MDKNKTLLVIEPNDIKDIFFEDWIRSGYHAARLFRRVSKPFRAIRRIFMKHDLPFFSLWLNDWFRELDKYDVLILHMSRLTRYLPFKITEKYPDLRIICWYRNTIDQNNQPIQTDNPKIEYWSFDRQDCKKYQMRQNIQYYCQPVLEEVEKDIDIYFVGYNKGREEQIKQIEKAADQYQLNCCFNIVENDKQFVPYTQVKKDLNRARSILEINKKDQVGFTLRTMESLFYGVKLITNNESIMETPLYNRNNIFIISKDGIEKLPEFVRSAYDHRVDYLKEEYSLDAWFKGFFTK